MDFKKTAIEHFKRDLAFKKWILRKRAIEHFKSLVLSETIKV